MKEGKERNDKELCFVLLCFFLKREIQKNNPKEKKIFFRETAKTEK